MPNMDSIQIKTNELLRYYCSCHGNLVTIAMRFVANVSIVPRNLYAKYGFNTTQDKGVIDILLWLPW